MDADNRFLDLIIDNIKDLKTDITNRFNMIESKLMYIEENMVTKEECKRNTENCPVILETKKKEIDYKFVGLIGSIVTGGLIIVKGIVEMIVGK